MSNMTAAAGREHRHTTVGMRELSQRTARVLALVRAGETVEITDRGKTVARIVPAVDDRYDQLVAAGVIRPAKRPFDVGRLPEPVANLTDRDSGEWLDELRGGH
jgi:prevent-host-death family protein